MASCPFCFSAPGCPVSILLKALRQVPPTHDDDDDDGHDNNALARRRGRATPHVSKGTTREVVPRGVPMRRSVSMIWLERRLAEASACTWISSGPSCRRVFW